MSECTSLPGALKFSQLFFIYVQTAVTKFHHFSGDRIFYTGVIAQFYVSSAVFTPPNVCLVLFQVVFNLMEQLKK